MFRQMYQAAGVYPQAYNKNAQYPLPSGYGYVPASSLQQQQMFYNPSIGQYAQRSSKNQLIGSTIVGQKTSRVSNAGYQKGNGYQLKVGGVVVGSWANGQRNAQGRMNRAGMVSNFSVFQ